LNDLQLAQRIVEDDVEAVNELVRCHFPPLYRFLRQLTGRAEDAEDLAQQTLIRARRYAARYDGRSTLGTWLHRLAYREFTHWRRRQRWTLVLRQASPVMDRGFRQVEDAIWLEAGLIQLPDGHRATLLLVAVQGLSVEEAASVLGIPVGTVKSRLHHARKRLRELLGGEQEAFNGSEALES